MKNFCGGDMSLTMKKQEQGSGDIWNLQDKKIMCSIG